MKTTEWVILIPRLFVIIVLFGVTMIVVATWGRDTVAGMSRYQRAILFCACLGTALVLACWP